MEQCAQGLSAPRRLTGPMRELALTALRRMYLPRSRRFVFTLRRTPAGHRLEGVSRRYTAIALIGLRTERPETAWAVLAGQDGAAVCRSLIDELDDMRELGEVALTLWAARAWGQPAAERALRRLVELEPVGGPWPTVELAWSLTALSVPGPAVAATALADRIAGRLLATQSPRSNLFAHWPGGVRRSRLRGHVLCFADLVYPIQALSHYHRATGSPGALDAAGRAARRMCALQGPAGQWWWHYDVRTGQVIERYPVYAVHQDGMGPMALLALKQAGGEDYGPAIERSLAWLEHAPEIDGSLMDTQAGVIWRKVCRREPAKLSRGLQALASRLAPPLRVPGLDWLFPPKAIDWESRPYHMGWLLHAFGPE